MKTADRTGVPRAIEWSLQLYAVLLRAYPKRFLASCGREMKDAFAADLQRAFRYGRAFGVVRLWLHTLYDFVTSVVPERVGFARQSSRRPASREPRHRAPLRRRRRETLDMFYDFMQDLRYGFRTLARTPTFTAVAIVILALGIGANTTMFTIVNSLFFEPPPHVAEPDRLVRLYTTHDRTQAGALSYPDFAYYRSNNVVFDGVFAYSQGLALTAISTGGSTQINGWLVSPGYFDVLGVRMAMGRPFVPDDGRVPGGEPVAVISHRFWRQSFGEDSSVVGATLTLNGHPFTVIGVAPEGFRGASPTEMPPEVWLPMTMRSVLLPTTMDYFNRVEGTILYWVSAMARLKPGVSIEQAQANMEALGLYLAESFVEWNGGKSATAATYRFHARDRGSLVTMAGMLAVVVAIVLLIASANIAILLLARASARAKEMGVRIALGAGRGRVIRQMLTESLLLGLGGGVLGFVVAFWSAGLAANLMPFTFAVQFTPDLGVLTFAIGLAAGTAMLFGCMPALQASRMDVASEIQRGRSPGRSLMRNALVVGQVGLSVLLVTGAVLFARSLNTARAIDLGFETERRLVVGVNFRNHGYDRSRAMTFIEAALQRIASVPGVEAVSTVQMIPFMGKWMSDFTASGVTPPQGRNRFDAGFNSVGPDYFGTMGIPLVAGREFTVQDGVGAPGVVIVNEVIAATVWPGQDAIGKQVRVSGVDGTVVGVARNATYYNLGEEPRAQFYIPTLQDDGFSTAFLVRTAGLPLASLRSVQNEINTLDPNLAVSRTLTMEDALDSEIGRYRVSATLVSLFGFLALLLATVGLYGVLSYLVVQRTREIGIRVALGATRASVGATVLARGMKLAAAGIVIGVAGALVSAKFVTSFLYGISPRDPVTFIIVPIVLMAVACVASFLPARRATLVDPMVALRSD
ncbi:MAG: ABC transporter permease [Gemmatimonadetes bacterium]|nr:ABC transporter permease [Gemmatimonadota bacterium]